MKKTLEGIANDVLAEAGLGGAVNIYSLIKAFRPKIDVRLAPAGTRPMLLGRTIIISAGDPPERQRFAAAHELAHLVLREREIRDTEWRVNWLASSLLHPEAWFRERLAVRGLDLRALREDYPFTSHEAIARRAVNLGGAVAWVCDRTARGRSARRYCSWGTPAAIAAKPTRTEWDLVRLAASEQRVHQVDGVGAWPLPGPTALRVIALSRVNDLARLSGAA